MPAFLRPFRRKSPPVADLPLSNDEDLHRALLHAAQNGEGREYLTESVLGNPDQTFGVEIEFARASKALVESSLRRHGLLQRGWQVKFEAQVSGEVVSPVLQDTPEAWDEIREVCKVLRRYGGKTNSHTGGHIHVGKQSSGLTGDAALKKLGMTYAWAEDLLYRLGGGSGPSGSHRGSQNNYSYCHPMNGDNFSRARTGKFGGSKGTGLNFRVSTIEFRYNDGFVDPERIQANIIVACALMHYAASGRNDIPVAHNPVGVHDLVPDPDDRLLRAFADIVLQDPKQRLKIYSVYTRTRWREPVNGPYVRRVMQERGQHPERGAQVLAI